MRPRIYRDERTELLSVRLHPAQLAMLRQEAARRNLSLSNVVREVLAYQCEMKGNGAGNIRQDSPRAVVAK